MAIVVARWVVDLVIQGVIRGVSTWVWSLVVVARAAFVDRAMLGYLP
jgi:hypothetical protein